MIPRHKPSGNNNWETPDEVFNHWNGIFQFELDVCADDNNYKCIEYFDEEQDGLIRSWKGRNWMNPPYGRGELIKWCRKAYEESLHGNLTVALLPVSTSTIWWQTYVEKADYKFFYPYRLAFLDDGKPVKGNNGDSVIVIWGLAPKEKA